ncbi:MAG: ATP-binding protein, partial [Holosporaceae bacterium]|nr:ATP-binding protein [Holosporaceae bacterium]
MQIISADERLKLQTGVKAAIFGCYGVGKTSLLKTLDEPTLCLDFEAGLLAVQEWSGDSISVRTWEDARDIACLIGGANPALKASSAYSQKHFEAMKAKYKDWDFLKYACIFIDSITIASKLCLTWCKMQPESFSEKSGKPDTRSAYGLLASEMSSWLNQFQHIPDKDVIIVGLLEQKTDDFNRINWLPQIEGSKTTNELPGIVDEVISMVFMKDDSGKLVRKFVCHTLNANGYPAKDRSGKL